MLRCTKRVPFRHPLLKLSKAGPSQGWPFFLFLSYDRSVAAVAESDIKSFGGEPPGKPAPARQRHGGSRRQVRLSPIDRTVKRYVVATDRRQMWPPPGICSAIISQASGRHRPGSRCSPSWPPKHSHCGYPEGTGPARLSSARRHARRADHGLRGCPSARKPQAPNSSRPPMGCTTLMRGTSGLISRTKGFRGQRLDRGCVRSSRAAAGL